VVESEDKSIPAESIFNDDLDVTFHLENNIVREGVNPKVFFSNPLKPRFEENYQMTVVPRGAGDDLVYALVHSWPPDGAREFTLQIPLTPGLYEVRLFARYPYNMKIIDRKPVLIVNKDTDIKGLMVDKDPDSDLEVSFELKKDEITTVDALDITFSNPLIPRGREMYRICIVAPDSPSNSTGHYCTTLEFGIKEAEITTIPSAPGEYEVRLFGRYSTERYLVIHRQKLVIVSPGPDRAEKP